MATIPGTRYAEGAPSGSTGQVLMSPPSEGEGQRLAAGIEKMGAAVLGYAINVQKQEMSVDYYEKKRQIDEAGWEAHNAVTGDEEADNKIWEKFEADTQAITQSSKYKDVNSLLTKHLNQVAPNWQQGIYTRSLTIRKENARDQLKLEWTKSLENGDTKTANDLIDNALKLGAISQAEFDHFSEIAPAESHIVRAERLLAQGNNEAVLKELDQTKNMKLTTEQLKQKESLRLTAEKNRDDVSRALMNDTIGKISSGMPLNEVGDLIQQTIGLDDIQKTKLMNFAIDAAKTWQKTGINPYTNRQDEAAFAGMLYKVINDPTSVSEDEIWLGTGKLWTTNDTLMLLNKKNKADDTWYKESHPVVEQYMGRLWDLYQKDDEILDDQMQEWAAKRLQLEAEMKRLGPDATAIEKSFQDIVSEVKEKKAKSWLDTLFRISSPASNIISLGVELKKGKTKLPEPKTQAEYDALPSGTQYKHPDGTIKVKK